jgi:hypothetical protein
VRSAARFWTNTPLSSAIGAENISVSTFRGKRTPVQNLTPIISVTIIAWLAWIICFFAEIVVGTEQEEVVFPFSIISVKNAVVDDAMLNFKAQSSNEAQIPNRRIFDIESFVTRLAFACLPRPPRPGTGGWDRGR